MSPIRKKFFFALSGYTLLGIAASLTLDGTYLGIVLIVLVAFAVKSWITVRREELDT